MAKKKALTKNAYPTLANIENELLRVMENNNNGNTFHIQYNKDTGIMEASTYSFAFPDVLEDTSIMIDIPDVICFLTLVNLCKNSGGCINKDIIDTAYMNSPTNNEGDIPILKFQFSYRESGTTAINAILKSLDCKPDANGNIVGKTKLVLQKTYSFDERNKYLTEQSVRSTIQEMLSLMFSGYANTSKLTSKSE